jgi:hypothetical protein
MKPTRKVAAKRARRHAAAKDLTAIKSAGVKGGIVINWAASNPAKPGEERGVIAIIKPVGGA